MQVQPFQEFRQCAQPTDPAPGDTSGPALQSRPFSKAYVSRIITIKQYRATAIIAGI
jgi:hypothetical protein